MRDYNDLFTGLFCGILIGLIIGIFSGAMFERGLRQKEAVEMGYAEYNDQTGKWQWITKSSPQPIEAIDE